MKYDVSKMSIDEIIHNKDGIIEQKKAIIKTGDIVVAEPIRSTISTKGATMETKDDGIVHVKVIANMAYFMDSQFDVLSPNSWNQSIKSKGINFPFLKDHQHSIEGVIGETTAVYGQDIDLSVIGVESHIKKGRALVFEADIKKEYNQKAFTLYRNNKINQHSIALQYVKIDLAVNDPEYKQEYELWVSKIDNIINKDQAMANGYFFYVSEIRLIENSAVLWGANSLTPTLEVKHSLNSPNRDIQQDKSEPSADTLGIEDFVVLTKTVLKNG